MTPSKEVISCGLKISVTFLEKERLAPAFSLAFPKILKVYVRDDLPPRVRRFVENHEIYHVTDKYTWGGWVGRELRANLVPGLRDPVGLLLTIWATISSKERLLFYLDRVRRSY
jgi:hypothetical protein